MMSMITGSSNRHYSGLLTYSSNV